MRYVTLLVAAGLILTVTATAGATTWLYMEIEGVIEAPGSAVVGDWMQVGPIGPNDDPADDFAWGTINSYSVSSDLPGNLGDLDMYGWAMTGTIDSIDVVTLTICTSGTGWIHYLGGGFDVAGQHLEEFTWEMTTVYTNGWHAGAIADVTGTLTAQAGTLQPTGWPVAVDWSIAGTGFLNGTFDSSDNTLRATVIVPEPLTMLAVGMGIAGLAGYIRKRKMA